MTYTKLAALALAVLPLAAATCGCTAGGPSPSAPHTYELGTIGGFGELVNSGVKTLALSEVLAPAEMDAMLPEAEKVAARNNVKLHRESSLLVTDLFPADVARGKDVLLIYQGATLDEYQALEKAGQYTGKAREAIARRFGRMLSYPAWRINELLAQNTSFRTMRDFGVRTTALSSKTPRAICSSSSASTSIQRTNASSPCSRPIAPCDPRRAHCPKG